MKSKTVSASTYFLKTFSLPNIFLHINSVNTNTFLKMNSDATDGSNIPSNPLTELTSLEVANILQTKFNLKLGGKVFAFALDSLPYCEDDPVLIIDYLQMDQARKATIVNFLLRNGGQAVGTSGHAFRFVDSDALWGAKHKMLCAHPEVFYRETGPAGILDENGRAIYFSPIVTAKSVHIKTCTEKSWTTFNSLSINLVIMYDKNLVFVK
uniref:Uncharacterized protein n=1 Tax=Meloidogyne enterolobii TaxID=390850 RepID=A0A6V7UM00_MELEN|nr:unnamed protein product [Meloidogyne enterolobii]